MKLYRSVALPTNKAFGVCSSAGILLLTGSTFLPWWHLINTAEPGWVTAFRFMTGILTLTALAGMARPAWRTGLLLAAGAGSSLMPLLLLLLLTLAPIGSASMAEAIHEARMARILMETISYTDISLETDWMDNRQMENIPVTRSEYTWIDGVETASFFAKGGWYLGLMGGPLLLIGAWLEDSRRARQILSRYRGRIGAAGSLLILALVSPILLGHIYWNLGRASQGVGDYAGALENYQVAARWDHRLQYDLLYHYEIGRLYEALGMAQEPDYWAMVGEKLLSAGMDQDAYQIYRTHFLNPDITPAVRMRYANALLQMGIDDYNAGRYDSALEKWRQAEAVDPDNLQLMYSIAIGRTKSGQYAQAISCWQDLISVNNDIGLFRSSYVSSYTFLKPISARAWSSMAWCYYQTHNENQAMLCHALARQTKGADTTMTADQ